MLGYGRGHGVIMDKHYRIVNSVEPAGSTVSMDEHEFMLLPDGKTALIAIYHPRAYDMIPWGVNNGMGWIQDSVFQEIEVETGKLLFEWRSLDHVHPSESYVAPMDSEISGDGRTKDSPWDYFHINSIDKNADGDYLISARHVSAIYKISGKDGHIIWRLHGAKSDYHLEDFSFSSQHDARFIVDNSTHTVMSLFDNASNGYNETEIFSSSMKIEMDHRTKTAHILQRWGAPDKAGGQVAKSQGNMQILPNGNVVSGWGNNAFLSEHLDDGSPVFYSWIALTGTMIYRVYKANWTSEPLTQPNIWAHSKEKDDMALYVSWNGATEVTHWKFYTSDNRGGPFDLIATIEKLGFETKYKHKEFKEWAYAEALHDEVVLSRSSAERTFVPSDALRPLCDEWACPMSSQIDDADAAEVQQQKEEEEQQLEELDEERMAAARKAMVFKLLGGLCILMGLTMASKTWIRRSVFGFIVYEKYKQPWRGKQRYSPLNSPA